MASEALAKIGKIQLGGYIDSVEVRILTEKYQKILSKAEKDAGLLMKNYGENF